MTGRHTCKGLTLLEALVALVIASILAGIGLSTLPELVMRNRISTSIQTLNSAMRLARNEAILRNQAVTLCPLNSASGCYENWNKKLTMFEDSNSNATLDAEENIIREFDPLHPLIEVRWRQRQHYIRFRPNGAIGSALTGTLRLCTTNYPDQLDAAIVVARTGRTRIKKGQVGC